MYKQAPKSPTMKALVGNQKNLPQALKAQIEAAPGKMMSPAKQTSAPELKTTTRKKGGLSETALANAGRDMLKSDYGIDNPNMSNKAIADSIKKYKRTGEVRSKVKQGLKKGDNEGEFKGSFGSPAQMKSPAKVKDNLTGSKVKGYAKSNLKVDKVRDKQERKETKAKKVATAKSDGKVTRLEKKGIKTSQAKLKNKQVAERNNDFQDQKVKDKTHKESTRLRNKSKKLNDAVAVGMDKNEARKKMSKADAKADKRVAKATKRAERRKF